MKIWDKLKVWLLFNQDYFITIGIVLIVPLFYFTLDRQYDKENPIDYDRYSGVAELTALEYEALFGPAMYGSAEPVLNGFYVGYQYFVNGITYSNTLYIDSREKAAIKHYVRKQQKDSLEVCYDIVRPDHSRLRVKQRKLAVDINVNSVFE